MKNIGASVSAVLTAEKKEAEEAEVEEEEYHPMRNEMIFCLDEAPEYQISAVAEWAENSRGDIMGEPDTYFLHAMTGQRCETPWTCMVGLSYDEYLDEIWETLAMRIVNHKNIVEDMRREKEVCV